MATATLALLSVANDQAESVSEVAEESLSRSVDEPSADVEAEAAAVLAAKTLCNLLSCGRSLDAQAQGSFTMAISREESSALLQAVAAAESDSANWIDEVARAEWPQVAALLSQLLARS